MAKFLSISHNNMIEKELLNQIETIEQKESLEYKKRIVELFKIGLNSDDIYAWHGTSLEAIKHLAEHGKMPIDSFSGKKFYYVPSGDELYMDGRTPQEEAKGYAHSLAEEYYVLNRLPFEVKNRATFSHIFYFDFGEDDGEEEGLKKFMREEAIPNGIDEQTVIRFIREAREKVKGVLVTLSKRIIQDFRTVGGDSGGYGDEAIATEDGLPIGYITGIKPLGDYERKWFEKLQKEIS